MPTQGTVRDDRADDTWPRTPVCRLIAPSLMPSDQDAATALVDWFAAEADGDDVGSEIALRRALSALPRLEPPENLAELVVAAGVRAGVVPASAPSWRHRPARVVAWSLVALIGTMEVGVVLGPLFVRQLARLLNFSVQGFVWIVGGLEQGLDAWSLLVELGRAAAATLATPQVSVGVVVIEFVGVAALYALLRVLSLDRERKG